MSQRQYLDVSVDVARQILEAIDQDRTDGITQAAADLNKAIATFDAGVKPGTNIPLSNDSFIYVALTPLLSVRVSKTGA